MCDVGCGTGFLEGLLAHRVRSIVAIDATQRMLLQARQKFAGAPIHWVQADAQALPVLEPLFDLVCSNAMLHHVFGFEGVLSSMIQLLKPGGKLFLGVRAECDSLSGLLAAAEGGGEDCAGTSRTGTAFATQAARMRIPLSRTWTSISCRSSTSFKVRASIHFACDRASSNRASWTPGSISARCTSSRSCAIRGFPFRCSRAGLVLPIVRSHEPVVLDDRYKSMIRGLPTMSSWHFPAAVLVAVATCATILASVRSSGTAASLHVDMEASAGHEIQLFLNDLTIPPKVLAVQPGVRQTYVFDSVSDVIELLRIDPTDAAQADVRLYSVVVMAGSKTIARFDPPQLREWFRDAIVLHDDPTAFAFRTLSNDSVLVTRPQIPGSSGVVGQVFKRILIERPFLLIVLLLPALVLASTIGRQTFVATGVFALAVALVPLLVQMGRNWRVTAASIDVAVSRASFLGQQLATQQLVLAAALVVAATTAVVAALAARAAGPGAAALSAVQERVVRDRGAAPLVVWWVGLALLFVPDLTGMVGSIRSVKYVPHWDSDQSLVLVVSGKSW